MVGDDVQIYFESTGGERAGLAADTSVGRPRWLRMRRITSGSSMRAISSKRSPQRIRAMRQRIRRGFCIPGDARGSQHLQR